MCLYLCLYVSLSLSLSLSLSVCLCLSISISIPLSYPLSLIVSISLNLSPIRLILDCSNFTLATGEEKRKKESDIDPLGENSPPVKISTFWVQVTSIRILMRISENILILIYLKWCIKSYDNQQSQYFALLDGDFCFILFIVPLFYLCFQST